MEPRYEKYDLILVGSSFSSLFFLKKYLEHPQTTKKRVLILERGKLKNHSWHRKHKNELLEESRKTFSYNPKQKQWWYAATVGGGSNWWWGCTPRFLPSDFELNTKYGVGKDWPISYSDLEPFYSEAEQIMQISGERQSELFSRSSPYPQPPHNPSKVDRVLLQAFPGEYFIQPTARSRTGTKNRAPCCASGVCSTCPVDAKFTVLNELTFLFEDPRVELLTETQALNLHATGNTVESVEGKTKNSPISIQGEVIALGANPIFNSHILLQSGITEGGVGKGIHEQASVRYIYDLHGLENFQGSTSITGQGYMFYDQERRKNSAACLIENQNVPTLRSEEGKWTQRLHIKCIFEDLPQKENAISLQKEKPEIPGLHYQGISSYAQKGIDFLDKHLEKFLAPLPIEKLVYRNPGSSEGHILGTTPMGKNPSSSVVDQNLVHHRYRNLLILGGSTFPSSSPTQPTLTISALSLRAAEKLFQQRKEL